MDEDTRILAKIATLYYKENLTHEKIAKRLGVSRQTIGRYIQRALDSGIVRIEIQSPLAHSADLEYQLEKSFQLREAIVLTPPADTDESLKETLGEATAEFLVRRILPGDIIGVSWSSTLLQCALKLQNVDRRKVTVVQMNGSLDRTSYSTRAEFIVDRMAQAFNGTPITLVVPLSVDSPEIKTSMVSDSRISAALSTARRARVALFGVGEISTESSLYKAGYLNDDMLKRLKAAGAVGDICGRFFDTQGRVCIPELDECTLAIELSNLRSKKLAVAIAGGVRKTDAIWGTLRGGYCNVLITDEETAQRLIARAASKGEQR